MIARPNSAPRARLRGTSRDDGIAMIMVMGTIVVLTALLTAALGYAMQVQPQARKDQDWNAALAAAQAGVDDYIARLNGNDSYWGPATFTDCANTAIAGPVAPTNACGWNSTTPAGWRDVQLGNSKAGRFHYDVDPSLLASQGVVRLTSTGKLGTPSQSRTIQVNVSRGGPTSFLYYTDFEDADPGNTTSYGPSGADTDSCGKSGSTLADYWWVNPNRGDSTTVSLRESSSNGGPSRVCREINFITADTLDGAVHFNDTPLMLSTNTPKFLKGYETADPNCEVTATHSYDINDCKRGGTPDLNGNKATWAPVLDLEDNSNAFATFPGCVYTGDTRIRFKSDGTMDVWNTMSSGSSLVGPGSPAGTYCGTAASFVPTSASDKTPSGKQNIPVPSDMVIYVKAGAGASTCKPGQIVNGASSGSTVKDVIPQGSISSRSLLSTVSDISFFDPDRLVTTQSWAFSRPTTSAAWTPPAPVVTVVTTPTGDDHPKTFDCGSGNVYIEGTVKGRVTVAAANNVIVTSDLLLDGVTAPAAASGSSMVGLVSGNSVVVYHPVHRASTTPANPAPARTAGTGSCSTNTTPGTAPSTGSGNGKSMTCTWTTTETFDTDDPSNGAYDPADWTDLDFDGRTSSGGNRYIYGSMQTLQHSFWVQNYNRVHALGTLNVRGSIAQRWRGIVGTGNGTTGFAKNYSYDTRLRFSGPPYFPQWTNAVWGAQTTGEIKPAY